MGSEISVTAKLAAAVDAGTVVNVKQSVSFDSLIGTASAQFDHRSTTLAISSGSKTVLPTGSVTISDASKFYWALIRNTHATAAVQVLIEYSSGNYASAGVIPGGASANGGLFITRMQGTASTYPRIALIGASATIGDTPIVETVVVDA